MITACTFGCWSAAETSIETISACGSGERRIAPCSSPGSCTSSTIAALAADEAGVLLARKRPEADHVSPLASNTATLTVLQRPHLIRTRLVIDSSPIEAASTFPHSTHT